MKEKNQKENNIKNNKPDKQEKCTVARDKQTQPPPKQKKVENNNKKKVNAKVQMRHSCLGGGGT